MNNSSKFEEVWSCEDPNHLILHSMNPARKRARTGDPDDPHVGPIMSSSISEPDTGTVQTTHTRAVLLNGHVVAEHVDLSRLREHIDKEVEAVSIAMRCGSRFLEMQVRLVLSDSGGVVPNDFPWKLVVCQAFAAMQTRANPQKKTPKYDEAKVLWRDLTVPEGSPPSVTLQAANSLTFESNAYYRTLLSNYSKISLCPHVFWTLRFVYPHHWDHLKVVLASAWSKKTTQSLEVLRLALPKEHMVLVEDSLRLQKTKFDESVVSEATTIRWTCLGMLDAEAARFPDGKPMRGSGPRGKHWVLKPSFFPLVPQCREASRFVTLDKQWAWKFLGLKRADKEGTRDVGIGTLFHKRVWERTGHGFDGFPQTIKTNGVEVHIPFLKTREVLKSSTDWKKFSGVEGADQDTPSSCPQELVDALRSSNPRGLFHIQATELLDEDNPALVGAIGIDPGVKNLVTSSTGVKVTRQDYYGTCRHKKRIKKDKKNKKKKTRRVWTHSKRGVKPQSVRDAEAYLKAHMQGVGQRQDAFLRNLQMWLSCTESLRKFYGSRTWRCGRAARGGGLRRALALVVAKVVPDPNVLVAFGNYPGRRCRHGDTAGPVAVKGLRRALARHRVVVVVDEFRTTLTHHQCGLEMTVCPEDRHEKICPRHGQVDRDVNAGLNIREVLVEHVKSGSRPSYLCRQTAVV